MAKEPAPGSVKTRLTPPLTYHIGAYLYEAMLSDTIDILISLSPAKKHLFIEPENSRYFEKYGDMGIKIFPQSGSDLGEKMEHAARLVIEQTGLPTVIIGTDIPLLTPSIILNSVSMLSKTDVVIGPCDDGGYYLIGLKNFTPIPFQGIAWSSKRVLRTTISNLKKGKLSYTLTEKLFDIDTAGDIEKHVRYMEQHQGIDISRTRFSRAAMKLYPHLERLLRPG
jgi:rSAM/selenodomain-associated transferase 1